jgi:hypothetical protein
MNYYSTSGALQTIAFRRSCSILLAQRYDADDFSRALKKSERLCLVD